MQMITPEHMTARAELQAEIRDAVAPYYRPENPLPYHNLSHAMDDVVPETIRLIDECREHGMDISWEEEREEIAAGATHDTNFALPLAGSGFRSKEERSGADARLILPALGYTAISIERGVIPRIATTEPGTRCQTDGQKRLRRADINNLAANPVVFLSNSVKLFYEARVLHSEANTEPKRWSEFVVKQQDFLNMLLEDDLAMPHETGQPFDCVFMRLARRNVDMLSSPSVQDGLMFCRKFGAQITRLVPLFHKEDITEAAA